MKAIICLLAIVLCSVVTFAQVANFDAPDTVCVNSPVTINNTSTGGSTWYWNFCSGNLTQTPTAANLGNPGFYLSTPVFTETAKDGNNFYAFVVNNTQSLVRLNFGNSLLNTPIATNFGNLSNAMPFQTEGIQIAHDADGWHVLIVGGSSVPPNKPSIAKVDFGPSLANNSPSIINWGNIGNMAYPTDLYLFQEAGQYYALTANADNNTITRLSFGTNFQNPPTGVNLGNLGNLVFPTGIYAAKNNGNWYVFVTNSNSNTITRLDFGNSLLNTPTAVNLGNPGNTLNTPRDIYIFDDCGNISGLIAGGNGQDLVRIDFAGGVITGDITGVSYGNIGGFDYPHSLSSVFREGDNLYTLVANAFNNTLSRVVFASCTSSSVASSILQTPPSYTYSKAGTYTVTLAMDEGLPTQQSYCRTIVVVDSPSVHVGIQTSCNDMPIVLDAGPGFNAYQWFDGSTGQTYTANVSGHYGVAVSNGGCTAKDTGIAIISPVFTALSTTQQLDCAHDKGTITINVSGGIPNYEYSLGGVYQYGNNQFTDLPAGIYQVLVTDSLGCSVSNRDTIAMDAAKTLMLTVAPQQPTCNGLNDGQIQVNVTQSTNAPQYSIDGLTYQPGPTFTNLTAGPYTIYVNDGNCNDTVPVDLTEPSLLQVNMLTVDESCDRGDGEITINTTGGTPPYTQFLDGQPVNTTVDQLKGGTYNVNITDANGCTATSSTVLNDVQYPDVTILNHDTTINIGESVQLYAINAPDYTWSPATGLDCADCSAPIAKPTQPTTYVVTTVTGRNCVLTDTVTISLTYNQNVFVPTAFSPNNDGLNDVFRVKATGVSLFVLAVYDRWGKLLFVTHDTSEGWDGLYKGLKQPVGTYVYLIEYAFYGDERHIQTQKGSLTLVK
jgi:gliding motility-associated-like protein